MIDHSDVVAKMNAKYDNLYATAVIKAGTYPGQDKDNQVSAVWNILVTNDKMSDQDAYNIVKTDRRQEGRPRRRAQGCDELHGGEPGDGQFADPVASGRGEVLQRTRREDVKRHVSARFAAAPLRRGRLHFRLRHARAPRVVGSARQTK